MSSSRLAWLPVMLGALVALAGCRDLTLPEPADPIVADLSVYAVGLGTDGPLVEATVVIDNSRYVEPEFAGAWSAVTGSDGIARFPSRLRGTYDVTVSSGEEPGTAPGRATPQWTAEAVDVGNGSAVVAYPGLPVETRIEWPELTALGIQPRDFITSVYFEVEEFRISTQDIADNGAGIPVGVIPWAGVFRISVSVESDRFDLVRYFPQGSFDLEAGSVISVPSPLEQEAVEVRAGGSPLNDGRIELVHDTSWLSTQASYRLVQDVDVLEGRVLFFLVEPTLSEFRVQWLEGPRFLDQRMFLSAENPSPGPIDLGEHTVTFRFFDESGQPVPGVRMAISDGAVSETWWDQAEEGQLLGWLDSGSYRLEAAAGSTSRSDPVVLDLDGDTEFSITLLEREAP